MRTMRSMRSISFIILINNKNKWGAAMTISRNTAKVSVLHGQQSQRNKCKEKNGIKCSENSMQERSIDALMTKR